MRCTTRRTRLSMNDLRPDTDSSFDVLDSFSCMQELQEKFSDLFFDKGGMSNERKEEMTRSFALALHHEVSSLVGEINFKDHVSGRKKVMPRSILYEGVDVFRYLLAVLNLWDFTPEDFLGAFKDRDSFLHMRHALENNQWKGEPVIIVDIDDVICAFREGFSEWLLDKKGIPVDVNSTEYYHVQVVQDAGFSPEALFEEFIDSRELPKLKAVESIIKAINLLHAEGFWVHLLTARPASNLQCLYDTYSWLKQSGLKFDKVSFSAEKLIWLVKTNYFEQRKIICAIDDSTKHSMEYAKHGTPVLAPKMSYNNELLTVDGVDVYYDGQELVSKVHSLYEEHIKNE